MWTEGGEKRQEGRNKVCARKKGRIDDERRRKAGYIKVVDSASNARKM